MEGLWRGVNRTHVYQVSPLDQRGSVTLYTLHTGGVWISYFVYIVGGQISYFVYIAWGGRSVTLYILHTGEYLPSTQATLLTLLFL